jgi:hypothetical protein
MVYIWLDRGKLGGRLQTKALAMKLWTISQKAAPHREPASPILLRFEADASVMKPEVQGYAIQREAVSDLPLGVRVFNLSEAPRDVKLSLAENVPIIEGPRTLTVRAPAEQFADASWRADLSPVFGQAARATVQITAAAEGVERISPLAIDLLIADSAKRGRGGSRGNAGR